MPIFERRFAAARYICAFLTLLTAAPAAAIFATSRATRPRRSWGDRQGRLSCWSIRIVASELAGSPAAAPAALVRACCLARGNHRF